MGFLSHEDVKWWTGSSLMDSFLSHLNVLYNSADGGLQCPLAVTTQRILAMLSIQGAAWEDAVSEIQRPTPNGEVMQVFNVIHRLPWRWIAGSEWPVFSLLAKLAKEVQRRLPPMSPNPEFELYRQQILKPPLIATVD